MSYWNRQVEQWLTEETHEPTWSAWYPGRPVLVTGNDYGLRLFNGDTDVAVVRNGGHPCCDRRSFGSRRVRDDSASRRPDHACDDHSQGPAQPSPGSDRATSSCRFAAADAGIVVHRGHASAAQGCVWWDWKPKLLRLLVGGLCEQQVWGCGCAQPSRSGRIRYQWWTRGGRLRTRQKRQISSCLK